MADFNFNLYTQYAIGFIKSANLEHSNLDSLAEVHEPTLVIYATVTDKVHYETTCLTDRPRTFRNKRFRFKVPVHSLETPVHCKNWIKNSLESTQLKCVASEIKNPKNMLTDLVWNLKKKLLAGEKCTGVMEMDVTRVTELREKHHKRVVEAWGKSNGKRFESAAAAEEENTNSTCCAICLNVLDDKEIVLELTCPGRHVFHSECITAWLTRKRRCPLCRNRIRIRGEFWVWLGSKESGLLMELLLPSSMFPCCQSTEKNRVEISGSN